MGCGLDLPFQQCHLMASVDTAGKLVSTGVTVGDAQLWRIAVTDKIGSEPQFFA